MGGSAQSRSHLRRVYALVAAFGVLWSTTVLPALHQWGHRDDHVHTAAGIVPLATHDEHEDDCAHEHEHEPGHEHESDGAGHDERHEHQRAPFDSRHGEGALEHGYAVLSELPAPPVPVLGVAQVLELEPAAAPTLESYEVRRQPACRGPPAGALAI